MEKLFERLWTSLDELSVKDPAKYQDLMKEAQNEMKEDTSIPEPHMCISFKTEEGHVLYLNVLQWTRVPDQSHISDPVNLTGGHRVTLGLKTGFCVAAHPNVLKQFGLKPHSQADHQVFLDVLFDFLEASAHIKVNRETLRILKCRYVGKLDEICSGFLRKSDEGSVMKDPRTLLQTLRATTDPDTTSTLTDPTPSQDSSDPTTNIVISRTALGSLCDMREAKVRRHKSGCKRQSDSSSQLTFTFEWIQRTSGTWLKIRLPLLDSTKQYSLSVDGGQSVVVTLDGVQELQIPLPAVMFAEESIQAQFVTDSSTLVIYLRKLS